MSKNIDLTAFDIDPESMNLQETEKKEKILYSPSPSDAKAKNNVYQSIIRFIPNISDPINRSILRKTCFWLDAKDLSIRGYYDSPKTIGQNCELDKLYWKLYNAANKDGDLNAKEKLKLLSKKEQYHSFVYVVKDEHHPELEGKIMIFRYNMTIHKLIEKTKNPSEDEIEMDGIQPCNPFNLYNGKDFILKISKKGQFPDYSECRFAKNSSPLKINGKTLVKGNAESATLIKEHIIDCIPDISMYDYQPLNDAQKQDVRQFIQFMNNADKYNFASQNDSPKQEQRQQASKSQPKQEVKNEVDNDMADPALEEFLQGC